jgi:hypothetical protein
MDCWVKEYAHLRHLKPRRTVALKWDKPDLLTLAYDRGPKGNLFWMLSMCPVLLLPLLGYLPHSTLSHYLSTLFILHYPRPWESPVLTPPVPFQHSTESSVSRLEGVGSIETAVVWKERTHISFPILLLLVYSYRKSHLPIQTHQLSLCPQN